MRTETVLSWATAAGYRTGDNPARWRGNRDQRLPSRRKIKRVERHLALLYRALPEFMAAPRQQPGIAARALEFTILTTCRTSEALAARFSEFDLDRGLWTELRKAKKTNRKAWRRTECTEHQCPERLHGTIYAFGWHILQVTAGLPPSQRAFIRFSRPCDGENRPANLQTFHA